VTFTDDGAWCWFQDPRAVHVRGARTRTYAQWVTHDGRLEVGAYDHLTGGIETHLLKERWDADDHNVGAFLVLPDRRLMVFYARHNREGLFCRAAQAPEDIARWGEEVTISADNRITYAHPVYLRDERRLYVFYRGPSWKPTFCTSEDGMSWSEPQILIQGEGREARGIRPYLKVTSDGQAAIHFAFTDGHPRNEPGNSLYYLRYQDGHFSTADGKVAGRLAGLPVSPRQSDRVYDGTAGGGRAWVWDIALDDARHPVIAYTRLPAEEDHRYCYARWTGDAWLDVEITPGGGWFPQTPEGGEEREPHYSGGMVLHPAHPETVYTARPVRGQFEIERWDTPDRGKTWQSRPVTEDSKALNVRPVVPRGYDGTDDLVLWMTGAYEHYTRYHTAIRILVPSR
jgi:hypothetical protein